MLSSAFSTATAGSPAELSNCVKHMTWALDQTGRTPNGNQVHVEHKSSAVPGGHINRQPNYNSPMWTWVGKRRNILTAQSIQYIFLGPSNRLPHGPRLKASAAGIGVDLPMKSQMQRNET
ncbi:hypothetical protein CLCR_06444 [Cladophialophora carrionii]|uniref:Uncharacterized protein n=1 Tax=Cladophialophora carrionii TaxID=86049 RepID=A0A1C1C7R4_9EURO|nr:hypothetical protein CLCR_06444 [Cladophialophora carrionii]